MAETAPYPYETRLNILHGPLEVVDVQAMADACTFKWFNQTLCQVNGSVVRMGVFEGEYHWHKHDEDDEFFYVVSGQASHRSRRPRHRTRTRPGLCGAAHGFTPDSRRPAHRGPNG